MYNFNTGDIFYSCVGTVRRIRVIVSGNKVTEAGFTQSNYRVRADVARSTGDEYLVFINLHKFFGKLPLQW